MKEVFLTEICNPKQWKTIPAKNLLESGYPVFGANGKIGFYNAFTHEFPTLLITCRGATCGTINISEPKSYVNGNAMALDDLSKEADMYYLKYFLEFRGLNDVISGSAQPQITRQNLKNLKIPLPPLAEQQRIAAILDEADKLCQLNQQLITKYEQLSQSLFLEMFGDPVTNPKGWEVLKMSEVCSKVTDGTHDTPKRLKEGVKFITGKHIRPFVVDYKNSDYVTKEVHEVIFKRCNPAKGDVLYTNIGVNLGTAALNIVDYEFSMKNVALLKPLSQFILGRYLEYFLNSSNMKSKIVWIASLGGAQQFLSLTQLRRLKVNIPPIQLQTQFADRVQLIEVQKQQAQEALQKSKEMFNALLQKAFKGELVS